MKYVLSIHTMYNKHLLHVFNTNIYCRWLWGPTNLVMYYSVNVFKFNEYSIIKIYYQFIINTLNNIYIIYIYTDVQLHSKMTLLNLQFYLNFKKVSKWVLLCCIVGVE